MNTKEIGRCYDYLFDDRIVNVDNAVIKMDYDREKKGQGRGYI